MIVTSSECIHGMRVVKTLGLATGTVTRSLGCVSGLVGWLKNLLGGEVDEYTKVLAEAREQALDRMKEHARSLGGNAVIAARFASSEIARSAAEIMAYGTAVVIEEEGESRDQGGAA
ncbi:MAG: YbjQ family protein [Planctomycetes bacterium]|nr:YbjQ family protein [Planctomycetota bacterium]